jgi:hypothetical protein
LEIFFVFSIFDFNSCLWSQAYSCRNGKISRIYQQGLQKTFTWKWGYFYHPPYKQENTFDLLSHILKPSVHPLKQEYKKKAEGVYRSTMIESSRGVALGQFMTKGYLPYRCWKQDSAVWGQQTIIGKVYCYFSTK